MKIGVEVRLKNRGYAVRSARVADRRRSRYRLGIDITWKGQRHLARKGRDFVPFVASGEAEIHQRTLSHTRSRLPRRVPCLRQFLGLLPANLVKTRVKWL